jgi:putative cell wall-binding protein
MRSKSIKKSLAATAVLASSVVTGVGLAGSAQATTAGASNSPLAITNGTHTVLYSGQTWTYQGNIGQAAWAPDASRVAYVDGNGNVVTERAGGSGPTIVAPAKAGATRSNPTWVDGGKAIVFSETVNGVSKLEAVPTYTAPSMPVNETDPISLLASKFTEGAETAPDSNGHTLAFQHHNATTNQDEIWVQDAFGRGSAGPILVSDNGSTPSVSPDGKTIAFLRKDSSGDEQVWTVAWNGQSAQTPAGTPKQLTTDAHDHLHPAFSPDGSRIAYEAGPGKGAAGTEVDSIASNGTGERQESNKAGLPGYQPSNSNTMVRLEGGDRIGTAIAASQAEWTTAPGNPGANKYPANKVVLSRSDQFADALGGSTLATTVGAPLLLTPSDHLDAGVKAEIARVLGSPSTTKTVYVLGGEQALSPAVANAVHAMGYTVKRIAGADRYATSVAIANQVTSTSGTVPDRVLVATGNLSPDALSAGAAAEVGAYNGPLSGVVILTDDKKMPASTASYLARAKADGTTAFYGVGGEADTALTSIGFQHTPLVGATRYETSYLVARTFFGAWTNGHGTAPTSVGFATGTNWADALSGGAFMGMKGGPLLLVNPATGEPASEAENWILNWSPSITTGYVFGGTAAVPSITDSGMGNLIGPMGGPVNYVANPKN